jgi:hypothetical protein
LVLSFSVPGPSFPNNPSPGFVGPVLEVFVFALVFAVVVLILIRRR